MTTVADPQDRPISLGALAPAVADGRPLPVPPPLWLGTEVAPAVAPAAGVTGPRPALAPPSPAPLTAADFSPERMLRGAPAVPEQGWRRVVHRVSGGLLNPAPSAAEQRQRALIAAAKAPIRGCRRVAVLSRKGGIGKTTTTLNLGHTFAAHRGDRVVALDANPDAGSLGYRVRRETQATVTQLLTEADRISRYSDVRAYTNQAPTRLEVIAADDDPRITVALGEAEYRRVVGILEHHYNLVLIDTGTGVLDSATQGVLRLVDQVVICAAPGLDASRASGLTLDWLDQHHYGHLVKDAVVVINQVRPGGLVEIDAIERHFAARCRAVVRVPWDARLSDGAETALEELEPATRDAYLQLAAAVATGFTTTTEMI